MARFVCSRPRQTVAALVAVAGVVTCTTEARAYCRTRSGDPAVSSCPDTCGEEGLPLFWAERAIEYSFDVRGFPGLSELEVATTFDKAFGRWARVKCDGTTVDLTFTAREQLGSLLAKLEAKREAERQGRKVKSGEPSNVIGYLSEEQWAEYELSDRAYAITQVSYEKHTGEIRSADILFNGTRGPFGKCAGRRCAERDPENDLESIAVHEIGHLLGLSHSDVPTSTMYCNAANGETQKRDLEQDDAEGLCAVYPPPAPPAPVEKYRVKVGCSALAGDDAGQGPGWSALIALGLLVRRARRFRATWA